MKPEEVLETIDDIFLHKMEDEVNFGIHYESECKYLGVNSFGELDDSWSSLGGHLVSRYLGKLYPDPKIREKNYNGWWYFKVRLRFFDSEKGEIGLSHQKNDIYKNKFNTKKESEVIENLKEVIQILNSQDIIYMDTSSSQTLTMRIDEFDKLFIIIFCWREIDHLSVKRFSEFNK